MASPPPFGLGAGSTPGRPGDRAVDRAVAGAARTEAVLTAALVIGGAWLVLASPRLRRAARVLGVQALRLVSLAAAREVQRAWRESAPPPTGDVQ